MKTVSERLEQIKDLYLNELLTNLDRRFPQDNVDTLTRLNNVLNPVELKSVSPADLGTYGGDDLAETFGDRFGFDKDNNDYPDFARLMQMSQSHNSTVPYHTIHHSEQQCAHFCSEWLIVRYEVGFVK